MRIMSRNKSPRRSGLAQKQNVMMAFPADRALKIQQRNDSSFKTYAEANGCELTVDEPDEWIYDPETGYTTVAFLVDSVRKIPSMPREMRQAFCHGVLLSFNNPKFLLKIPMDEFDRQKGTWWGWPAFVVVALVVFALASMLK